MNRYKITHHTIYQYDNAVSLCHSEARLLPRDVPWQILHSSRLSIHPRPALKTERLDFFGNRVAYFTVQDIHQALDVTAESLIEVGPRPLTEAIPSPPWETVRLEALSGEESEAACQYWLDSPFVRAGPRLLEYAQPSFPPGRPLLEAARDLTHRIFEEFTYDPHFTTLATPLDEVIEERRGVCQDFAHLGIGCLRALGLAARYISGYLETLPPPGQPRLVGADASHAWLAVYLPGQGWAEFDPTNDCMPGEKHIVLAWGRDYGDVAPLKGVTSGGGSHTLEVGVDVMPLGGRAA